MVAKPKLETKKTTLKAEADVDDASAFEKETQDLTSQLMYQEDTHITKNVKKAVNEIKTK